MNKKLKKIFQFLINHIFSDLKYLKIQDVFSMCVGKSDFYFFKKKIEQKY